MSLLVNENVTAEQRLRAEIGMTIDQARAALRNQTRLSRSVETHDETVVKLQTLLCELIDERMQVETTARKQQAVLKSIINSIPYSVFWKDRQCIYRGCNERFAKVAGVESPDQLIGKNDYELPWKPEEAAHYQRCDLDVMENARTLLDIEESQLQADGTEAFVLTS